MSSFLLSVACVIAWAAGPTTATTTDRDYLLLFQDGASHWQKKHDRFDAPRHSEKDVALIADNILLLQRTNGGWPPNEDPQRILSDADRRQWETDRSKEDTSFDNRTTYSHVRYLAHAFEVTGDDRYRAAAMRGLEFIFSAETPRGGWPHSFPRSGGYYRHITFMDDVTVGVLTTLCEIRAGDPPFAWVDPSVRARCQPYIDRGVSLILDLQVEQNGLKTIWAGQYDENTLKPCAARSFEPPALTASESVDIVRFLMSRPRTDERIVQAVTSAIAWYEASALNGFRIERVPAPPEKFSEHTSRFDLVEIADPQAPRLWARFYDLNTNQPILCDRGGKIVPKLADLSRERRTGYSWYGSYGKALLEKDYPAWKNQP